MNKQITYVAGDVSKGYVDICVALDEGKPLQRLKLYDQPKGHAQLRELLSRLCAEGPVAFAVEATGGYERNWLASACSVREETTRALQVYQVNPLSVQRYLSSHLHRNVTDEISAMGIAEYLRGRRPPHEYSARDEGVKVLYNLACDNVRLCSKLKTQLMMLMSSATPELVCHTRKGLPVWLLDVLSQYGTSEHLALALPADVSEYLDDGVHARHLIEAAKATVASMTDAATAAAVKHLAKQIRQTNATVDQLKAAVLGNLKDHPVMPRLTSIPGIGMWTAAVLVLELGDFARFATAEAVSAFVGLDPQTHQSGDGSQRKRISRRGSARLRAALFMPTLVAIRRNPVIRKFHERLVNGGKPKMLAVVAAMRKLLVIAWSCARATNPEAQFFDSEYEVKRCRKSKPTQLQDAKISARSQDIDPAAPVSRRALKRAQKNKAASPLQHAVKPQKT